MCGTVNVAKISFGGFGWWSVPGSLKSEPLGRPFLKLRSLSVPSKQDLGAKPLVARDLTPSSGEKMREGEEDTRGGRKNSRRESESFIFF